MFLTVLIQQVSNECNITTAYFTQLFNHIWCKLLEDAATLPLFILERILKKFSAVSSFDLRAGQP